MVDTKALVRLIEILDPLSSEDRLRNVNAALTALGDPSISGPASPLSGDTQRQVGSSNAHSANVASRLKQSGVSTELADAVFAFHDDGTFSIIALPGRSKREQTLNAYVLFGLGTYLASGSKDFSDAAARELCKSHGCYDPSNHSATMKSKHPAFLSKGENWMLTVPGIKEGVALVREAADAATKS